MERFPGHGQRIGVFRESPGSDIIQSGMLKKLKTMKKKYFVLRSTSSSGPARLDYYDNKKKFESGHPPKRTIHLHQCFNINKKSDAKHKFAIALYTKEDCFSIVMEDGTSQEKWLNSFLEYQNEYLLEGESPKPHYDFVWQGLVKPPQKVQYKCVGITGIYRLCLSEKSVFLVKINKDKPDYTFQFSTIRRCGHSDNYFFMEVGRGSSTGEGELWMQVDDSPTAESMHNSVLHYMTAARSSSTENFRRRSNTSSSAASVAHHRNTIIGDELSSRHRTASESHHGSPRRNRITVTRPISTVEYASKQLSLSPEPLNMGSSPCSPLLMEPPLDDPRVRSDSVGSRGSRGSRASSHHAEVETPIMTPETSSVISHRSMTPESTYPISEEESPDYLNMTPGQRSGSPSPTRERIERPGSSCSDSHETKSQPDQTDGYMDMKPGSVSSSMGNDSGYMDMMMGSNKVPESSAGYMVMSPGIGPSRATAPIPIHPPKETTGYMDMMASGLTSQTQTLPTVKESGSGEAYLPMTPTGQSPMSSYGLKPAKVVSYLSDDSMSGEFPKRAYSVGSRPTTKPLRHHHIQDIQKKQVLDSSRSSSAPHLIVQKSRSPYLDKYPNPYDTYLGASPLSQSYKSDDSDSFMEMDFYRPRTASDSYGCRPRASSFGKQYTTQGHRPRSSSYGQASSRGKLGKLDSMDSIRTESQELNMKPNSEESLGKFSSSSRNSSSDSLRKLPEDVQKVTNYLKTDYMDMGFEKRNTPSPNVMSPPRSEKDAQGYVDMTLGSSAPKSSRGVSPSSSSHSLGSSPASSSGRSNDKSHHDRSQKSHDAIVVKASGHVVHKPGFSTSENHLKVANSHLLSIDKRSPSSSGRESEDESYVPFQPASAQPVMSKSYVTAHDLGAKGHMPKDTLQRPTLKIQHGYSRSLDSGIKVGDTRNHPGVLGKKKYEGRHEKHESKHDRHEGKHKTRIEDEHRNKHGKQSPKQEYSRSKSKLESVKDGQTSKLDVNSSLQEKVARGHSPTLERKLEIPDTDIFSNKIYQEDMKSPPFTKPSGTKTPDTSSYMEYSPGFEVKSPSFELKKKPSEYMEIDIPAMSESSDYMEADFSATPKSVKSPIKEQTSDYVEADFMPTPKTPQTPKEKFFSSTPKDKQYSSSPRSIRTPKTPKESEQKDSEIFQYMDFDPAERQDLTPKDSDLLKTPTRVQAFIAHPLDVKEQESKKGPKDADSSKDKVDGHKSEKLDSSKKGDTKEICDKGKEKQKENIEGKTHSLSSSVTEQKSSEIQSAKDVDKDVEVDNTDEVKGIEKAEGKSAQSVHCDSKTADRPQHTKDKSASKNDSKENKGEGHVGQGELCQGHCKDSEVHCSAVASKKCDNKTDTVDKVDSHNIVIRERKTIAAPAEPIEDEGYVDILDFSNKTKSRDCCGRQHHRSGSSSSSNSEKPRLSIDETPYPDKVASFFVEEPCLMPETPKSYISDDSIPEIPTPEQQFSYIQDESDDSLGTSLTSLSSCEGKEIVLRSSGKTPVRSRPSSVSQLPSAGQIGEGVMIRTRSASGQPMIQTGSGFSRQTSVPAVPSFSPRTSQEIQNVGRGRKASGPATFANTAGNKQLTSSLNAGVKKSGEPQAAGQEHLTKQNSLPSMAVPVTECIPRQTTMPCPQDMQSSRHSFTNLSAEYEQMSFPANNLSAAKSEKSSSVQQLAEAPPQEDFKLNYAQLDLHGSLEGIDDKKVKSRHPSSLDDLSQPPPVYAEIDHEKTENMKNSSNKDVKFTL